MNYNELKWMNKLKWMNELKWIEMNELEWIEMNENSETFQKLCSKKPKHLQNKT